MAWELAPSTINRGESVHWELFWPEDHFPGIQVFQARPVHSEGSIGVAAPSTLMVSNVSFEWRPFSGYFYYVTVTHVRGFSPATYRLRGVNVD